MNCNHPCSHQQGRETWVAGGGVSATAIGSLTEPELGMATTFGSPTLLSTTFRSAQLDAPLLGHLHCTLLWTTFGLAKLDATTFGLLNYFGPHLGCLNWMRPLLGHLHFFRPHLDRLN